MRPIIVIATLLTILPILSEVAASNPTAKDPISQKVQKDLLSVCEATLKDAFESIHKMSLDLRKFSMENPNAINQISLKQQRIRGLIDSYSELFMLFIKRGVLVADALRTNPEDLKAMSKSEFISILGCKY